MAEAQLSVELTANITNFRQNLTAAAAELNRTGAAANQATGIISQNIARVNAINLSGFTSSLRAGEVQLRSVATTSNTVSQTLARAAAASANSGRQITAGSNQAAFALTNLGRVAQDAPFGFIGIQNNLNPLLESFQRLRQESGSNAAALRSLGTSLIGPAGLGVALSLITSAITFYTLYQQKANKATKEAKEENKDYADSLGAVDRALLKGAQSAETSLVPLKALYDATQNTSLSLTERKKAVDSLQEQYPAYFKNIKDEAILAGDAETAYRKLTAAIIAKAKASAVEDEIKENAKLQRTLEKQAENNKKAEQDARRQQDIQFAVDAKNIERLAALRKKNPIKSLSDITPNPDIRNKGEDGQIGTLKTLNDLTAEGVGIQNQKNIAKNEELKLTTALTDIVKNSGVDSILPDKTGAVDAAKDIRTVADVMKQLRLELLQAENQFSGTFGDQTKEKINANQKAIDELIKLGIDPASEAIKRLKAAQDKLLTTDAVDGKNLLLNVPGLNTNNVESDSKPINAQPILDFTPVIVGKTELDKALEDLEAKKDQFLSLGNVFGMASTSLSDGFAAIGEGLATGGNVIEAFGQVVINAFGNFLAELGKQSIAEGLFHIAKGVAYSTNPFTAALAAGEFSSGAGLIAAGGLLSIGGGALSSAGNSRNGGSTNQQPTAFANGGIIYGPTLGLMGEYAGAKSDPEVVAPLSKLKSIMGDAGQGSSVTNINGSSEQPYFIQRLEISGEKLVVITERAKKRLNRVS